MQSHIRQLERRVVILERTIAVLGILLAISVLLGAVYRSTEVKLEDATRTKQLQLVDEKGRVRASLMLRDGRPGLLLLDESGRERLSLVQDVNRTGLLVRDETGRIRLELSQLAQHAAALNFYDAQGRVTHRVPAIP